MTAGGLFDNIGDWMLMVALPVYVFTESGSGSATAAVYVINQAISVLLGSFGSRSVQPPRRNSCARRMCSAG